MADNMFKKYTESLVDLIEVGANVPGGTIGIDGTARVYVTLAASGGSAISIDLPDGGTYTGTKGGVGYPANCAEVAYDGSWLYAVAGVSNGETVPDSAAGTAQGTPVYLDADGDLTLTATDNDFVGIIDACNIVGGVAAVKIGVVA